MDLRQKIAENIKHYREDIAKISQQQLGEALGISSETAQNRVSQWETGHRSPNKQTIVKIAQVLGVSISDIIGHDDDHHTKLEQNLLRLFREAEIVEGLQQEIVDYLAFKLSKLEGNKDRKKVNDI